LLVDHVVTLLVDLRDSQRNRPDRPILILIVPPSAFIGNGAGDVFLTALPAILDACREVIVVAEAADPRSGMLRSIFAEPRASQSGRATARHFNSVDEALSHVEGIAPHDVLELKRQILRRSSPPRGRQ
jgi:hypothetical protein